MALINKEVEKLKREYERRKKINWRQHNRTVEGKESIKNKPNREWCRKNKQKTIDKNKRWRDANKHSVLSAQNINRAKEACPPWAKTKEYKNLFKEIYFKSQKLNAQVDHIVPLKHKQICGLHVVANLQILTPIENKVKKNKLLPEAFKLALISDKKRQ